MFKKIIYLTFSSITSLVLINTFIVGLLTLYHWVDQDYLPYSIFGTLFISTTVLVFILVFLNKYIQNNHIWIVYSGLLLMLITSLLPKSILFEKRIQGIRVIGENSFIWQDAYCFKYCDIVSKANNKNTKNDRNYYSYRWAEVSGRNIFGHEEYEKCCVTKFNSKSGVEIFIFPLKVIGEISLYNIYPSIIILFVILILGNKLSVIKLNFELDGKNFINTIKLSCVLFVLVLIVNYMYWVELEIL